MPFQTRWVDPEVFLSHNGVEVYYTYKDDDVDQGTHQYWFTTNYYDDESAFDVRSLTVPSTILLERHPPYISESFEHYRNASAEQRQRWADEWHTWHTGKEDEIIRQILREAIDAGLLTAEEQ